MNLQEEQYVHFAYSIENLNTARKILQEIKKSADHPLVNPAFQFALIEYSKPYRRSRGTIKKEQHILGNEHVPVKHSEMHKRILAARDEIHAHTDLTVREATLCVVDIERERTVFTTQNVIRGNEELQNIDAIIDLIEQTLDSMIKELKLLEAALPLTPE